MSRHYDYEDYEYIAENCDDLYEYDEWQDDDIEVDNTCDWENYYHNIADELVDE
jgi:hypothetical protein